MDIKRKRIRTAIIAAVLIIAAIAAIVGLKVDPADYRKDIGEDVKQAEKLLKEAKIGNDNGQYSVANTLWLEAEVSKASTMIDNETTEIDDFRKEAKALKKEVKRFDDLANKNSVSAKELKALKKDKEILKKEIKLEDGKALAFEMDCTTLEEATPVNPDVTTEGFFADDVKNVLKENKLSGIVLTFLHNNAYPGRIDLNMETEGDAKAYNLYSYNPETNSLSYVSGTKVKESKVSFSVASGGVWVLCEAESEDEDPVEDIKGEKPSEKQELIKEFNEGGSSSGGSKKPSSSSSSSSSGSSSNSGSTGGGTSGESSTTPVPPVQTKATCNVTIVCDTILNNMGDLNPAKKPYVPSNGVILGTVTVEIQEGETAFEVLKRVTRNYGIQMEFRNDPMYSGAYIEGINHLYEFDCGSGSGWMYKVNGWFPNYGCSQYKMKNGDNMVWCYTCNIGKDVGDQYYD